MSEQHDWRTTALAAAALEAGVTFCHSKQSIDTKDWRKDGWFPGWGPKMSDEAWDRLATSKAIDTHHPTPIAALAAAVALNLPPSRTIQELADEIRSLLGYAEEYADCEAGMGNDTSGVDAAIAQAKAILEWRLQS